MTTLREVKVCLIATSETLSQAQLKELCGTAPDESWNRGDAYSVGGIEKRRRFSLWSIIEHASGDDNDWNSATERLIERAQAIHAHLSSSAEDATLEFRVYLSENNGIFGYHLSAKHIAAIASLGAAFDMSVIVLGAAHLSVE